jgi:sulfur relay (sulfurtransferase) DsrF/TusC family protein
MLFGIKNEIGCINLRGEFAYFDEEFIRFDALAQENVNPSIDNDDYLIFNNFNPIDNVSAKFYNPILSAYTTNLINLRLGFTVSDFLLSASTSAVDNSFYYFPIFYIGRKGKEEGLEMQDIQEGKREFVGGLTFFIDRQTQLQTFSIPLIQNLNLFSLQSLDSKKIQQNLIKISKKYDIFDLDNTFIIKASFYSAKNNKRFSLLNETTLNDYYYVRFLEKSKISFYNDTFSSSITSSIKWIEKYTPIYSSRDSNDRSENKFSDIFPASQVEIPIRDNEGNIIDQKTGTDVAPSKQYIIESNFNYNNMIELSFTNDDIVFNISSKTQDQSYPFLNFLE